MVRTDPEIINFADELRREEQQDAIIKSKIGTEEDPEIQKQRAIEKRLSALRKFRMGRGDLPPVLFVINLHSGQVVAAKLNSHDDSDYASTEERKRDRASDTLRWLGGGSVSALRLRQNELELSTLPDWFSTRSEEPVPLLRKMARKARIKSNLSLMVLSIRELVEGILGFFMMAVGCCGPIYCHPLGAKLD